MKFIQSLVLLGTLSCVIWACSFADEGKNRAMEPANFIAKNDVQDVTPQPVEITIEQLVGTWRYTEFRSNGPFNKGISPHAELFMGINADFGIACTPFVKDGLEFYLSMYTPNFEIRDNKICATEEFSEINFDAHFNTREISCYLLNEKEMILASGKSEGFGVTYMYFTRLE